MNGLRVKFELDGTNYDIEGFEPLATDSKFNFGFNYPVNENFLLKLSYVKGNTLNFGFSFALDTNKAHANVKKQPRIQVENAQIIKKITARSNENLYKASLLYLSKDQINLQKASISDDGKLDIVISQSKYRNPVIASGRTINILDSIAPNNIKSFKVSEINGSLGMYSVEILRDSAKMTKNKIAPKLLKNDLELKSFSLSKNKYSYAPAIKYPQSFYSVGPELVSQIGGPEGFYFGNFRLSFLSETLFSKSISLTTKMNYSLTDNMDELTLSSDSILPHVRTDIVQYLRQARSGISIGRLQLNKFGQPSDSIFYKISAGIFEKMFGGVGGEILYRPFEKNYAVGLDLWRVKQRDFDQKFKFNDYETSTGHLSIYYKDPRTDILFTVNPNIFKAGY